MISRVTGQVVRVVLRIGVEVRGAVLSSRLVLRVRGGRSRNGPGLSPRICGSISWSGFIQLSPSPPLPSPWIRGQPKGPPRCRGGRGAPLACANEQEYERRPQDRSPLCRRCSAGSETFCPQVDEAPHVLAGPRHAAPPATCEPLVGSRSLLLHRPWNLSARKFASQPSRICMQRFVCGIVLE